MFDLVVLLLSQNVCIDSRIDASQSYKETRSRSHSASSSLWTQGLWLQHEWSWVRGPLQSLWQQKWLILQVSPRSTSVSMTTEVAHTSGESEVHFCLYDNKSGSYFRWGRGPLQSLWQQKWLILQVSLRSTSVSMTTKVAHTSGESKVHFSLYDNKSGSYFRWV